MPDAEATIRPATPEEVDRVEALLRANDLPWTDLRAEADRLVAASVGGSVVGAGGLEVHGDHGLLRSVVVASAHRGRGLGSRIVTELEALASEADVATLFLLTTTAAPFFRELGYEVVDRETAPPPIRQTTQFADRCPASATCLRRTLGEE